MISEKMQKALNAQINAEMFSAYLYLSMAAHFESTNLSGCANWMRIQVQEETFHAMKMYDYLCERGGRVELTAIAGPPAEWPSPLATFEAVLAHEQKVTGLINDLMGVAETEKDRASIIFLQWFVSEQVEEESTADQIIQQLKLMTDAPGGLFMLDRELGQRVFTPPTDAAEA